MKALNSAKMKGSIIIPTFKRPAKTLNETFESLRQLGEELVQNVSEIFLIDQNDELVLISSDLIEYFELHNISFNHLQLSPASVTKAKNMAISRASGDIYYFFDDDVEVQKGCLAEYRKFFLSHSEAGFLGGREVLAYGKSTDDNRVDLVRGLLFRILKIFVDSKYLTKGGIPVGHVFYSFFFCNFDQDSGGVDVEIDTARGCNWALRASTIDPAKNFFDTAYSGTALREETDAYLTLKQRGFRGYYVDSAVAIHKRQVGGCENLAKSLETYESKLRNEAYFQSKFYPNLPRLIFIIRTFSHCSRLPFSAWWKAIRFSITISKSVATQ